MNKVMEVSMARNAKKQTETTPSTVNVPTVNQPSLDMVIEMAKAFAKVLSKSNAPFNVVRDNIILIERVKGSAIAPEAMDKLFPWYKEINVSLYLCPICNGSGTYIGVVSTGKCYNCQSSQIPGLMSAGDISRVLHRTMRGDKNPGQFPTTFTTEQVEEMKNIYLASKAKAQNPSNDVF